MNEVMFNNSLETFEMDLTFVQEEYYSWAKNLVDNQESLLEELKDAIGDNRECVINELQTISKNVLKWNRFVESIIGKYKGKKIDSPIRGLFNSTTKINCYNHATPPHQHPSPKRKI